MARVLNRQSKYQESQHYLDSLFILFRLNEVLDAKVSNPIQHPQLIEGLKQAGVMQFQQYQNANKGQRLDSAIELFEKALLLLHDLRQYMPSRTTRQSISSLYYGVYESAIELATAKYQQQPTTKNLDRVYDLIQSSKAQSLLENIQKSEYIKFAGVPDELLKKEKRLLSQIAMLQRLLTEDPSGSKNLLEKLYACQTDYQHLLMRLKQDHSDYYQPEFDEIKQRKNYKKLKRS